MTGTEDGSYLALLAGAIRSAEGGDIASAIHECRKAIALFPSRPEAWFNRGVLRGCQGDRREQLEDLSEAARLAPDRADYAIEWQRALIAAQPATLSRTVAQAALRLLTDGAVDLQDSAPLLAEHAKALLGSALERDCDTWRLKQWERIGAPFLIAYWSNLLNFDAALDAFASRLRAALVRRAEAGLMSETNWRLAVALALQFDRNGHIQVAAAEETRDAETVAAMLGGPGGQVLRALYQPLGLLAPAMDDFDPSGAFAPLARRLAEIGEERALAARLPSFGAGPADDVSQMVKAQYEIYPYPRWRRLPPILSGAKLEEIGRVMPERAGMRVESVLIAGCGTGLQAVTAAIGYGAAAITAIDLSRASLAYAARQARAAGCDITFLRGDLRDCALLERRFDVIESTGVLITLADPAEGLRALEAVLAPGGLMKIALYSRAARSYLDSFRDAAAALEGTQAERVRMVHAEVLAGRIGSEADRARLRATADFYALEEAIDLLAHVHEVEMDVPQIDAMLADAGLTFSGFSLGDPLPEIRFRAVHGRPSSGAPLSDWTEVERCHPDTFQTMYNFWVSRPEG